MLLTNHRLPRRIGRARMAAGIAATFYATHCQNDSPLFLAAWYVLATLFIAGVGAVLGTRLLRW